MDNAVPQPRLEPEDQAYLESLIPVRRRATTMDLECGPAPELLPEEDSLSLVGSLEDDLLEPTRRTSFERRRRQKLLSSRCVRGFLALCVYAGLVLHNPSPDQLLSTTSAADNVNTASRSLEDTKALKMAELPKYHRPTKVKFRSTIPPDAIKGVTHADGTTTHWHKVPPTIYHKKQRPILSHAHSYHQEPLVFGRAESSSFFNHDSTDWSFSSSFIWLSFFVLLVDTSYREWQHYRFQQLTATSPQERRHRHYRRSPSPPPGRRRTIQ